MTESHGAHSYSTVNTGCGRDVLQKTSKALKASCTHAALPSNLEVHMQRCRKFLQYVNFEICLKQQFNSDLVFRLTLQGMVLVSELGLPGGSFLAKGDPGWQSWSPLGVLSHHE